MRIFCSALLGLFFTLISPAAFAACGPSALGTHRTIELDASKHRRIIGKESTLGLRNGEVILTFDDGPIAKKTARILKALRKECVKATFFAVARMAKYQPKLLRRIVSDGHTLGHHTYNHNRLPAYSTKKAEALVDRGINMVEKIAYGNATKQPRVPFFRYPYLSRTKATNRMMARKGLIIFDANIDANDWKKVSASTVHNRIMRRLKREKKGIILMHDIQNRTARMLPRLLRSLKAGGYKVVHIVPRGTPSTKPEPVVPVVIASAKKNPVAKKPSSIVELNPAKSQNDDVSVVKISKPVGSPAAAHGTEIELEDISLLNSKKTGPTPPAPLKPASLISPETTGNTVRRSGGEKSIVTHSIKATKSNAVSAASLKSRRWKLRSSQWILR